MLTRVARHVEVLADVPRFRVLRLDHRCGGATEPTTSEQQIELLDDIARARTREATTGLEVQRAVGAALVDTTAALAEIVRILGPARLPALAAAHPGADLGGPESLLARGEAETHEGRDAVEEADDARRRAKLRLGRHQIGADDRADGLVVCGWPACGSHLSDWGRVGGRE